MGDTPIYYIFLSYAHEDKDLAQAIETALAALGSDLGFQLEPIRDIHHFESGSSLKGQIFDNLEKSRVLFVIYTEALKRSHSYTGIEIGMFDTLSRIESKGGGLSNRKIVSMYLDNPPASEAEILGIKLQRDALGSDIEGREQKLDPTGALQEFLKITARNVLRESMPGWNSQEKGSNNIIIAAYNEKMKNVNSRIDQDISPKLLDNLYTALSRVIESSSVQQKLIQIRWDCANDDLYINSDVMKGSKIVLEDYASKDLFDLFGIPDTAKIMGWEKFVKALKRYFPSDAQYIAHAFESAASSALQSGPVDNEQFFLSPNRDMYRVIVTRHYSFYDGSRLMHMYFIPMLPRYSKDDITAVLALLNSTVKFKNVFLTQYGPLSCDTMKQISFDTRSFREKITEFLRIFLLIEDEAHIYSLDDPVHFAKLNRLIGSVTGVSATFNVWRTRRDEIIQKTKELFSCGEQIGLSQINEWLSLFEAFGSHVSPMNEQLGRASARFLEDWFRRVQEEPVSTPP